MPNTNRDVTSEPVLGVYLICIALILYIMCRSLVSTSIDTVMYALISLVLAYPLFKLAELIYDEHTSPLKRLRGPGSASWIYGNLKEIWENVLHFHCYYPHSFLTRF